MSAPERTPHGRRRRWRIGTAVAVAVLVVGLVVLALVPRSATATASLTVTPRTEAGAGAALLLADRYAALADSTGTLRAARDNAAPAGVSLDELESGTRVVRTAGTAAIAVRVTLADRETAAAAANAVVDTLVEAGAAEGLVDVAVGAEATPSRATTSPDVLRWAAVVVLLALAGGLAAAALSGSAARQATRPPSSGPGPFAEVDDLPGFLENPPGSAPARPAPAATGSTVVVHPDADRSPAPLSGHAATIATGAAVVVLVATAVLVAVPAGRSDIDAASTVRLVPATTLTAPSGSAAPGQDPAAPTTSAPASAAALAFESVPLGADGVAAGVTFQGVVLEPRAVGLTVTYPSVSITTDGHRSLAHVRLPTFNCMTAEPPADPIAAGCARSLTEYADLPSPQLQLTRNGDRIDLVGLFPTYTRPNGSAPDYTGRAYQLTVTISADGAARSGSTPAAGVLRIGSDSATTTTDPGVNVLQLPG